MQDAARTPQLSSLRGRFGARPALPRQPGHTLAAVQARLDARAVTLLGLLAAPGWQWARAVILLVLSIALGSIGAPAPAAGPEYRPAPTPQANPVGEQIWSLIAATDEQILLEVTVPEPLWVPTAEDRGCFDVAGFDQRCLKNGVTLPALRLPVAVPPSGRVSVHAEILGARPLGKRLGQLEHQASRRIEEEPARALAPFAALADDGSVPGWVRADSLGFVQFIEPGWAADLRLLALRVWPIRWNDAGHLMAPGKIRIRVEFAPPQGGEDLQRGPRRVRVHPRLPAKGEQPAFKGLHEEIVINPQQVAGWMCPPPTPLRMRSEEGFHSATKWLRIEIERRGIYVLTAADLIAAGVTDAVDLSALRLFCGPANELPDSAVVEELPEWMEPCALWIEPAQDQTWGEDTRVYFLGNGPDGWCADLGLPETTRDRYYAHPTSKHFTYWLCWDGLFQGEPMRVKEIDAAPGTMELINTARARIHVEKNTKYDSRPREAGVTWERFFYTSIRADSSAGAFVYLDLDGVVPGSSAAYRVSLWGRNWRVDQYVTHTAVIEVNARSLAEVSWMGVGGALATGEIEAETVRNTVAVRVPPRYDYADKALIDQIYLAWVEAEYERALTMERDSLEFFISPDDLAGRGVRISGLAEATGWMLLDASDRRNPVLLQPRYAESEEGYAAEFLLELSDSNAHMVLLKRSKAASPARMTLRKWGEAPWGDAPLRQCTAPIDFLIVTGTKLLEVAESLGEHRRHYFWGGAGDSSMPGRVAVVTIDQVCDEFAWGQHDPNAVRNLASFARSMWKGGGAYPTLSHLLLMGDAYYDPRDYLGTGSQDIVPSHIFYEQRFQTSTLWQPAFIADDWFGLLDGPDDRLLDLAVGRLTVGTPDEAGAVVEKIIAYETDPPLGDWRTRLILAADDICQGYSRDGIGYQHMQDSEKLSNIWAPRDARQGKVYLYEYGSECKYSRKPGATEQLLNAVAHGALLFNFIGHGSEIQLADERLLEVANISSLSNYEMPFLLVTASCAVGKFAHGGDGLSLAALRLPERGALAVISASSMASSSSNFELNAALFESLFREDNSGERSVRRPVALGPALLAAKWREPEDPDLNDLRYNFFGDPGCRFVAARYGIELELEGVPGVSAGSDTLIRGATAVLTGRIVDSAGLPVDDFSGTIDIVVLDSDIKRMPCPTFPVRDYFLPGARIFSNAVTVADGDFTMEFFVPTALRTGPRGPARIYAYAYEEHGGDATGAMMDLFIPETAESVADLVGPEIQLVWADAGAPQAGSGLVATLCDDSGIYVAALSPSRSVVVTIRDQVDRILVAEDLAASVVFGTDYREASVTYHLPSGLTSGQQLTLTMEASDNVGRRGSASLDFQLSGTGETRLLGSVFTMPNPMESETHILAEIESNADLEVSIFTCSGRIICHLAATGVTPDRARSEGLAWDGRDDDGDLVANGLYFYRVVAREASSGRTEERIERLVVLR